MEIYNCWFHYSTFITLEALDNSYNFLGPLGFILASILTLTALGTSCIYDFCLADNDLKTNKLEYLFRRRRKEMKK